jgi:hypothetical protein
MGTPEQHLTPSLSEQSRPEVLDPRHFYAAYVFDDAATRRRDVAVLLHEAQRLSYPVRYWWLSEAMDLQDAPDRLIVCVHHPSSAEDCRKLTLRHDWPILHSPLHDSQASGHE